MKCLSSSIILHLEHSLLLRGVLGLAYMPRSISRGWELDCIFVIVFRYLESEICFEVKAILNVGSLMSKLYFLLYPWLYWLRFGRLGYEDYTGPWIHVWQLYFLACLPYGDRMSTHLCVILRARWYSTDFTKSYIVNSARFNLENTFQEPNEHFIDIAICARWHAPYITAI